MAEKIKTDDELLKTIIDMRSSIGYTKDYNFLPKNEPQPNPAPVNVIRDMFRFDPVLSTALDTTVDMISYNGYFFIGKDKRKIQDAEERFDALRFPEVSDNILYQKLMYGDAFMELRRDGSGRVDEIFPLETTQMWINYDIHGKTIDYTQRPDLNDKRMDIKFPVENIIHHRLKWIGSQVYSFTPFESVARSFSTNVYANNYLNAIFRNLPPKMIYLLATADVNSIKAFREDLQRCKTNPALDLVITGEKSDVKNTVPDLPAVLLQILQFLRETTLMVTRVPPIWVGLPESSNRSNSEAQIFSFETRIKKIQQKFEGAINSNPSTNLMDELSFKNMKFKYCPVSLENEKSITEVAERLKTIGYKPEVIDDYLRDKGFYIMQGEIPDYQESLNVGGKSEDMYPSRQRSDKRMPRGNELNRNGVSEAGKVKMEKTKLS